jgi:hypothetical protein
MISPTNLTANGTDSSTALKRRKKSEKDLKWVIKRGKTKF